MRVFFAAKSLMTKVTVSATFLSIDRSANFLSHVWLIVVKPYAGRAAAATADNMLAQPPPTFVHRRAAANNLSARRRCHFFCVLKKRSSENFEDTSKNFREPLKKMCLAATAAFLGPAARRRRPKLTGAPPTK